MQLFTDFVFADFLVTYTPYVSKVVFQYVRPPLRMRYGTHAGPSPKLIPWFVSDVTPPDFKSAISSLLSPTFFPESEPEPSAVSARAHLKDMVTRWSSYIDSGVFALSVPLDTPLGESSLKVMPLVNISCDGI